MRQWESKTLGEQGYSAIEILRAFYGGSIDINTAEEVSGVPASYPGYPLSIGSRGSEVMKIQEQLNRISDNYPLIPKVRPGRHLRRSDSKCRPYLPSAAPLRTAHRTASSAAAHGIKFRMFMSR